MKTLLFIIVVTLATPMLAFASCQTVTITENGQMKICQVCTFGSQTTVNCF